MATTKIIQKKITRTSKRYSDNATVFRGRSILGAHSKDFELSLPASRQKTHQAFSSRIRFQCSPSWIGCD